MNSSWMEATLAWIGEHPLLAGVVIFAIAFCDALIIVGAVVPALPLLFAVGVLIGMGEISGPYAVASAALGAMAGDAISYWVGLRWGDRLRGVWPFSRYPQLLERGETLFRRNAFSAILLARYVGAIRPFVPAIAGMARMPVRRYFTASGLACVSWGVLFLAPGWVLGRAYDAVAAVAGHLVVVLGLLLAVLALAWAVVLYTYRWFAEHADAVLARMLAWSHRHPVLGEYSVAVFDPQRRESVPLALLAVLLLAIGWVWFALLLVVVGHGEPLGVDLAVHQLMLSLRNPLADYPLAALASLGDWPVLAPACAAALGYFAWRQRWMAAAHWLAALGFGLALTWLLGATINVVRPPSASSGFGFPSIAVTMSTIAFGFFAVLIARELPGRDRVWPYMVSGLVVAVIGFARLYLGAHWLSDVVGGMLLGIVWLLVLGIAYRRRFNRSFWVKPVAAAFYGVFALAALWYAPRNIEAKLAKFEPPGPAIEVQDLQAWWQRDWALQPARRNEFDDAQRWPLDVQVAGPLGPLRERLEAQGWKVQPQARWEQALNMFDEDVWPAGVPVLPATLDARTEALLMVREGARPDRRIVLRLWAAPVQLRPGHQPLWIGTAQTLHFTPAFDVLATWRPHADADPALERIVEAVADLPHQVEPHPVSGLPTLRLRTAAAGAEAAR
ncbi:phosphatase PAP2 family protein [Pseudoxanthomonas sp. SGNA-20]|uniref:bifunctional DedA family/phosphatase PAP2 family protein n=1 Tax=Pseudoxanthomonas sp. SGNA-20 TaxID=2493088 RepID=UPI000F640940|nr:bifunctional DedA family/phosphatase PAP2 family protein [Pseudoxanthomonas sp. SGNA-20]RRN54573.1 phosphatase PAP2 family protein [Pseudoxanthomonas sp. SGNA-20]RRN79325.1 phosphatase PAP2 family protein [Pseudoxanthomonas sp. SGD-10]